MNHQIKFSQNHDYDFMNGQTIQSFSVPDPQSLKGSHGSFALPDPQSLKGSHRSFALPDPQSLKGSHRFNSQNHKFTK